MNQTKNHAVVFCFVIFLSCVFFAAFSNDTEAEETRVSIAYPAKSMSWFPLYVAERKGFFKEEGLDPVMILMTSNVTTTALVGQQIDYTTNGSALLNGALKQLPLRILMGLANGTLFSLVVVREITSVQELKGKVIGINAFGGTQAVVSEEYLRGVGLEPGKSVKLLALGAEAARMAALKERLIHATLLPPPSNVFAEKQGYRILVPADQMPRVPQALFGTFLDKIKKKRDEVQSVITAIIRGHRFIQNNPDGAIQLIQEWNQLDLADSRRVYELSKDVYAKDGELSDTGIQTLAQAIQHYAGKSAKPLPMSDIVASAPLREALSGLR
jgi:NitT/TauT family transport system substrate-binding protein